MDYVGLDVLGPGMGRIGGVEETLDRARYALSLGIPSIWQILNKYRGKKAIICGGGPSIADTLPDIKRQLRLSTRTYVVALNKTHDWLLSKGVDPRRMIGIMIDPKPWVAGYQTYRRGCTYLLGSKLHKDTLDKFVGKPNTYLFQMWEYRDQERDTLAKEFPREHIVHIPGHSTVGLRALNICYEIGFREMELHGYDSCHLGGATHAYDKKVPTYDNAEEVIVIDDLNGNPRSYETNTHMARQFKEFFDVIEEFDLTTKTFAREPVKIEMAGTGALPYAVAQRYSRGRCSVRHVNQLWNISPTLMPGGNRDVPQIADMNKITPQVVNKFIEGPIGDGEFKVLDLNADPEFDMATWTIENIGQPEVTV